jgi:protein-tyrosine phosphatase
MAEAVFRKMVADAGLTASIRIDSAGTGDWHIGTPPHHGTQRILNTNQIEHSDLRARQVQSIDFEQFQYIVCMDADNVRDTLTFTSQAYDGELRRLLDYVTEIDLKNVPDPYFTGNFEQTFELVSLGCQTLLDYIKAKHHL